MYFLYTHHFLLRRRCTLDWLNDLYRDQGAFFTFVD